MIFMETIRMKVNMILCSYSSIFDNQSNSISLSLSSWEGEVEITIEVLPNVFKIELYESVVYFIKCLIDLAPVHYLKVHHSFQMTEPSYCI